MDNLLTILQWAFPAGLSIWQLVLIRSYRKLNKAKVVKDTMDVWQEIAESNNEELLRQNEKIARLRAAVARLEGMLFRLDACKYYAHCPARNIVQEYKAKYHHTRGRGGVGMEEKGIRLARNDPSVDSGIEHSGDEPP